MQYLVIPLWAWWRARIVFFCDMLAIWVSWFFFASPTRCLQCFVAGSRASTKLHHSILENNKFAFFVFFFLSFSDMYVLWSAVFFCFFFSVIVCFCLPVVIQRLCAYCLSVASTYVMHVKCLGSVLVSNVKVGVCFYRLFPFRACGLFRLAQSSPAHFFVACVLEVYAFLRCCLILPSMCVLFVLGRLCPAHAFDVLSPARGQCACEGLVHGLVFWHFVLKLSI